MSSTSPDQRLSPFNGIVYAGGKFETTCNDLLSPGRIQSTAKQFKGMAKDKYQFGQLLKQFIPNKNNWSNTDGRGNGYDTWDRSVAEIPDDVRDELTKLFYENLMSDDPMPMMLKVGQNVDDSHELIVKEFSHGGHDYIGILMLCPNSVFAPPHASGAGKPPSPASP
jgi:hypothetical protein